MPKLCPHKGPHYRVNPKGEAPGVFMCEACIVIWEQQPPDADLVEFCEELHLALKDEGGE